MSEELNNNLSFFPKWEPALDVVTFGGAGAAACLYSGISMVNPAGIGVLVASGVNALTSGALSLLFGSNDKEAQFLKLCATIVIIAASAFALPYAAATLGASSFFVLTSEVALTVGILDIFTKVATFATYRIGSWLSGSFSLPVSIQDLRRLNAEKLKAVRDHLESHPSKVAGLPLRFQVNLHGRLANMGGQPLQIQSFQEIGDNWQEEELSYLRNLDTPHLSVGKKKEINQLFYDNGLLPQLRKHAVDELPEVALEGKMNRAEAHWAHLYYKKHPSVAVAKESAFAFHKWQLPPIGEEGFDLKIPSSIEKLTNVDIQWHFNGLVANPAKWRTLISEKQNAFLKRFSEEGLPVYRLPLTSKMLDILPMETIRLIHHAITKDPTLLRKLPSDLVAGMMGKFKALGLGVYSLAGRVNQHVNWKKVGVVTLCGLLILVPLAVAFAPMFMGGGAQKEPAPAPAPAPQYEAAPPIVPLPPTFFSPPPVWLNPPPRPEFGSLDNNCLVPYEPIDTYVQENAFCPIDDFPEIAPELPAPVRAHNASTARFDNEICQQHEAPPLEPCQPMCPLEDPDMWVEAEPIVANVTQPPHQTAEPTASTTGTIATAFFGLLSFLGLLSLVKRKEEDRPAVVPVVPVVAEVVPPEEQAIVIPQDGAIGLDLNGVQTVIQLEESQREMMEQQLPQLLERYNGGTGDFGQLVFNGAPIIIRNPEFADLIQQNLKRMVKGIAPSSPTVDMRLENPVPTQLRLEASAAARPSREVNWEQFRDYVEQHCPGVSSEKALGYTKEGIALLQDLRLGNEVSREHLEDKLRSVVWGLMLHALSKNQGFIEGTFHLVDPDYRVFNFFEPLFYQRTSSHYPNRSVDGDHQGHNIYDLPAGKRTVLLGRVTHNDGREHIFIKPENWGFNIHMMSDPNALSANNLWHNGRHAVEFIETRFQGKQADLWRKEHFPHTHEVTALKERIDEVCNIDLSFDLKEWGFAHVSHFLEAALQQEAVQGELRSDIRAYLRRARAEFDHLETRKGSEVLMASSILEWSPGELVIPDHALLDLEPTEKPWQKAVDAIQSANDVLGPEAILTYFTMLRNHFPVVVKTPYLFPKAIHDENGDYFGRVLEEALAESRDEKPIFIPVFLDNSGTVVNGNNPMMVFVIDPKSKTIEYFDPKGRELSAEKRTVLGFSHPPAEMVESIREKVVGYGVEVVGYTVKSNTKAFQGWSDTVSHGRFGCWFIRERATKNLEDLEAKTWHQIPPILIEDLEDTHLPVEESPSNERAMNRLKFLKPQSHIDSIAPFRERLRGTYLTSQEAIFAQVERDLDGQCPITLPSGEKAKSAQELYEALGQNLEPLLFLQQGVFAEAQMRIEKTLGFYGKGMDQRYNLLNYGKLLTEDNYPLATRQGFSIDQEGTMKGHTHLELKSTETDNSLAVIRVEIEIDPGTQNVVTSWKIVE